MSEIVATAPEGPIRERWVRFVLTGEPEFETGYREVMFIGDFGIGKTRGLLDALMLSVINYPGARLALLRDTFTNLRDSLLPIVLDLWEPAFKGRNPFLRYVAKDQVIYAANGSRIYLFGLDTPEAEDRLKTSEFFRIFVDQAETVSEDAWDLALLRTRQKVAHKDDPKVVGYNYIKGAANWDKGENWIWRRFRKDAKQIGFRQYETLVHNPQLEVTARRLLLEGTARENLSLPESYFEAIALASESTQHKYFSGGYIKGQGLVFPEFEYAVHTVADIDLPGEAPVYVGGDVGIHERHPSAFVFSYLDHYGILNVTHSLVIANKPLTEVARKVAAILAEYYNAGHAEVRMFVDRDAWKRERSSGAAAIDAFQEVLRSTLPAGMKLTLARGRPNLEYTGTSIIKERLLPTPVGAPGLIVSRSGAPHVVDTFRTLTWEDLDKDKPPEADVHDALVYLVSGTPRKPTTVAERLRDPDGAGREEEEGAHRRRRSWRQWRGVVWT